MATARVPSSVAVLLFFRHPFESTTLVDTGTRRVWPSVTPCSVSSSSRLQLFVGAGIVSRLAIRRMRRSLRKASLKGGETGTFQIMWDRPGRPGWGSGRGRNSEPIVG